MVFSCVLAALCIWLSTLFFPAGQLITRGWATDHLQPTFAGFVFSILGIQCGWISGGDSLAINGPTWYISVLMICYVMFYMVLRFCKSSRTRENFCFALLVLLGLGIWIHKDIDFPLLHSWCGRGYSNFFIGVIMAQVITSLDTPKRKRAAVLTAGFVTALFLFTVAIGRIGNFALSNAVALSPAVLVLLTVPKTVNRLSDVKLFSYLGKISFWVYLLNLPCAMWLFFIQDLFGLDINWGGKYTAVAYVAITCVLAVLAYELYEKPVTMWLKNKFKKQPQNKHN